MQPLTLEQVNVTSNLRILAPFPSRRALVGQQLVLHVPWMTDDGALLPVLHGPAPFAWPPQTPVVVYLDPAFRVERQGFRVGDRAHG